MTWFKLDDGFAFHAKVVAAGNSAVGLWVRCGCWSAAQLTDGIIPAHIVTVLGSKKDADVLERVRLWVREGDDYVIPGWDEFQPSGIVERERRQAISEARAEAGRKGGQANAKQLLSKPEANPDEVSSKTEAPTRPDPKDLKQVHNSDDLPIASASSSSVEKVASIYALGVALRAGKETHNGYVAKVRANVLDERLADIQTLIGRCDDETTVAASLLGDPALARIAARKLKETNP